MALNGSPFQDIEQEVRRSAVRLDQARNTIETVGYHSLLGRFFMGTFHKVAEANDLDPGQGKAVEVGEQTIALFNVDGVFYAIGDTCTQRGGPLSQGSLEGTTVTCPWHRASFDVCTGKNLSPPAPQEVACYRVKVDGDDIQVEIP